MQRWLALILLLGIVVGGASSARAGWLPHRPDEWRVLWVPLDSRPINMQEAVLLGEAVGARLLIPPPDMLDWYADRRSDLEGLLKWWRQTVRRGDTVVFATNSLLQGGLIGSRDPGAYAGLEGRLTTLERSLRETGSGRRIALHVLPRAWPTQFGPDHAYTRELLERTELQHRLFLFGDKEDKTRLEGLERRIPAGARARQDQLIAGNQRILEALLDWASEGLVDEVVVGLDDARPYGMANLLHRQLEGELRERGLAGRVHPHYGADEIGFLLIAREALRRNRTQLKVAVEYDQPTAAGMILPYEGVSLAHSVQQKLELLGASEADGVQRLFVHTARAESINRRLVERAAAAYGRGEAIALADVSAPGQRDQLLVERLSRQIPLTKVAYGGWNTASNALGTALAVAAVQALHGEGGASERQRTALQAFQVVRYANDLIFQGEREELAAWAGKRGIDPTRFGSGQRAMAQHLRATVLPGARRWLARFYGGEISVADVSFPWHRTFEVAFRPELQASAVPGEAVR